MSRGRKIITAQNVVISAMITQLVVRVAYDVRGWRLVLLCVAVFWLLFRTLDDVTLLVLKGVRNDKKAERKSGRGAVPSIAWDKVRFCGDKQTDRDTKKHSVQVQRLS